MVTYKKETVARLLKSRFRVPIDPDNTFADLLDQLNTIPLKKGL